ncbi:MAG: hypothetical protein ACE5G2_09140, partial [Candidatus Krumholzibacteriia bacterium]
VRRTYLRALVGLALALQCAACAPVLPLRSKPGGAARWAYALARPAAFTWARDAALCRVAGVGVGSEGWLPDRGGAWILTYWSPAKTSLLEVSVDSDGNPTTREIDDSPARGHTLPRDWEDSPRVWASTSRHQRGVPINTFDVELAHDAEPERYPGQPVWRIRFYLQPSGFETHVVSPQAEWLAQY